jgi:hypothetical protein
MGVLVALLVNCLGGPIHSPEDDAFLEDVQRRTFGYFWHTTNPENGLTADRWPTETFASIAAVGFALTAYPIGVEHGWITREQGVDRTLTTLQFFADASQGDATEGMSGHKGFYYHFLEQDTGKRFRTNELSSIDTSLLMAGVLFSGDYFAGEAADEQRIRTLADALYRDVQWDWMQQESGLIGHGWKPETGKLKHAYAGYNEAMILNILALGSPTHPVDTKLWEAFTSTYQWETFYGYDMVNFGPLFGHQYSHVWIDFRKIQDPYMKTKQIDYFENSVRMTRAQRAYAIANSMGWKDYSSNFWGLTACDGPRHLKRNYNGTERQFFTYTARGASSLRIRDDGTLAPTAVGGSIAFAPDICIPALRAMKDRYGEALYGKFGFVDCFNPTFTFADIKLHHGKLVDGMGWFDTDYLGIDQGPIITMIENYRTELIWKTMKKNPHIQRGLKKAGFGGGWLDN